jgi:hypothetical protein
VNGWTGAFLERTLLEKIILPRDTFSSILQPTKNASSDILSRKSNWIDKAEELKFVVCFGQAQGLSILYSDPVF